MIMRVLLAAISAGMLAGAVAGAIQIWRVSPLILAAEVYENQQNTAKARTRGGHARAAEQAKQQRGASREAWTLEDAIKRSAYTLVSNLIMGVAFALILAAAVMLSGRSITTKNGALWGLVGYLVFTLAPTAGLAPELPGMPAADLTARQTWWWGTAIATAGGIALIVLQERVPLKALGVGLIALPHLIGAPRPLSHDSSVPAELAADFAANSLAMMALFWIVLGVALGWTMNRTRNDIGA